MRIRKKKTAATSDFEQFLKDYNCTYTTEVNDQATEYSFHFQAAHFVASIRKNNGSMEITFPYMSSAPIDMLAVVRAKCNEHNYNNILFKFSYSIDHEENKVNIHMSFFNNVVDPAIIAQELGAAFHFQREWQRDMEDAINAAKESENSDLESDLYKHNREMYMLRSLEMKHQLNSFTADLSRGTEALTLLRVLNAVAPLPAAQLLFMTVNTVGGQQRFEREEDIYSFDLRRVLVEGQGKQARLMRDYAVIDLHYTQGLDKKPRMLTISITAEGEDEHAIYSRITVTVPPRNASRANSIHNDNHFPNSVSLLIALDRSSDSHRQQEFDYMWSDARLKIKNGERDSLTDDEALLSQVEDADEAYNLYWGQQMFNQGRYLEASFYLENMYNSHRERFFEMNRDQHQAYLEAAYKLGYCYNELGQHEKAFYYLDLVANDGNIRHTMALVNAMTHNKDPRMFNYTERVLDEVRHNFGDYEEMPANIKHFVNFLNRRRGYAYIEFNQLDEAEKIFEEMLGDEDNADYAINELAHIKRLREQRGEEDNESPDSNAATAASSPDLPF